MTTQGQDERLVAQDPGQGALIAAVHALEAAFADAVDGAVAGAVRLEEMGAQHGRRGERHHHRDGDGGGDGHGEFVEETPDEAAHQEDGDEDGDQRDAHRHDGEADLAGAQQGGIEGEHASLDVAHDVFEHHDGVVDDEAGRDGKGHQRQIVQRVIHQVHHAEGADDGEGHGDAGNQGGADFAQEDEDDEHHEKDGDDQGTLHVSHGSTHGGGAVKSDLEINALRDGSFQEGQSGDDAVDGGNDVGAGLAKEHGEHARLAVEAARVVDVGIGVPDGRHVAEADGRAIAVGDDQGPVVFGLLHLIVVRDHPALLVTLQGSLGQEDVLRVDGLAHGFQSETHFVEDVGVGLDADGRLGRAPDKDLADTLDLRKLLPEDRIGSVIHRVLGESVGGHHQDHDGSVGGVDLAVGRIAGKIGGKITASGIDSGLHVAGGGVDVAVEIKLDGDASGAELARRSHLVDGGNAPELALQRRGHRRGHGLGTGAGQTGADGNDGEINLRQGRDRQRGVGQAAGEQQRDGHQRGGYGPVNRWSRDVHASLLLPLPAWACADVR